MQLPELDIQGHRGARGLLPENTIPSFLLALDLNVNTIELDLVVSKDKHLIVSHEPWFNSEICLLPDNTPIPDEDALKYNIYSMSKDSVQQFDCGSLGHPRFPEQKAISVFKPTLSEAVEAMEKHSSEKGRRLHFYNIETKSLPEGDDLYHPVPSEFAALLYRELKNLKILSRTTVQSFDPRILIEIKKVDSNVMVALLVENQRGLEWNINRLGFYPDIYSPWFKLVDEELVVNLKSKNIRLIPWTINDVAEMDSLVELGVNGIITDYPDRAQHLIR